MFRYTANIREQSACSRIDNRVPVDIIDTVEIRDVARLAKMIDAERHNDVLGNTAKPGQRCRMRIADGYQCSAGSQLSEQLPCRADIASRRSFAPIAMQAI